MVQSRHIVALLLAASLAGCGGYAMFEPDASFNSSGKQAEWMKTSGGESSAPDASDPASTGATPAQTGNSDAAALSSLFARAAQGKLDDKLADPPSSPAAPAVTPAMNTVTVADAGDTAAPAVPPPAAAEKVTAPRGRVYLFRGIAGLIYSRGMDKLADRIKRSTGLPASVDTYLVWRSVAEQAIADYRHDPQPVILIGHSMGGDSCLDFAEELNAQNIPVSLLVTYDPSRLADDVPGNVERYINIFQSSNVMGGGNITQGSHFHGHFASYNLKDHSEIIHINIEKADRIQEQLVAKIAELAATPPGDASEAVPLHLEVPADAAIELWDSGQPVSAHAGDTLKTLAESNHVPLWALAQINSVSESEPLSEGQRIVVPQYLAPNPGTIASTVSSYAPAGR
jgi:pimeloyl-ACP methyl ester carboxylesterase